MIPYTRLINFKFSLSSIFYIEGMLTIICNSSNGFYFVYMFAVDYSFHCNLDFETCPDVEHVLNLSCYLTTLILVTNSKNCI